MFHRAEQRGETGAYLPVDLVLDMLAGAVFFHLGIIGERAEPDLAPTHGSNDHQGNRGPVNSWLLPAGGIAAATTLIHATAGGQSIVRLLLGSALAAEPKRTLCVVWHMVTAYLLLSSVALLALAFATAPSTALVQFNASAMPVMYNTRAHLVAKALLVGRPCGPRCAHPLGVRLRLCPRSAVTDRTQGQHLRWADLRATSAAAAALPGENLGSSDGAGERVGRIDRVTQHNRERR